MAKGPLPKAGSRPPRAISSGSAMATTVATQQAASSARPTAVASSADPSTSHTTRYVTAPMSRPSTSPVSVSSRNARRIDAPTDIPRITSASVCVPTASAR